MKKEIFLDSSLGIRRAAIVEDGMLCEIHSEKDTQARLTESIFYGRIQSIRPSVNAAFVDIGESLNAFLPVEEGERLRCGDMILVQGAAKQATETKGLRITRRISLAGKWLVLIPGETGVHISKKIKDDTLRRELQEVGESLCPAGCALIVRTASAGMTVELLSEEIQTLRQTHLQIQQKAAGMTRPGLVYEQEPLHLRLIRDLRDIDRIVTNDQREFLTLQQKKAELHLSEQTQIEFFKEQDQLIFDAFQIETQIDKALRRRVWLPCGGYLIIDRCEAMTVIDVNSGKMILGRGIEETALHVNLEAAQEAARQLRLRDIGGMIVIDFIDMQQSAHRTALESCLKSAVKTDRTQVKVLGLTKLGLMEMTRRRVNASLDQTLRVSCSYCSGLGELLSAEEVARRALRQIRRMELSGQRGPFLVRCSPAAAQAMQAMPYGGQVSVYSLGTTGKHAEKYEIEQLCAGQPLPQGAKML